MRIETMWAQRCVHRGQSGFSTGGALMALGATATLAGMMAMNGGEQVAAAEQTVCAYEKTIVMTAIESDRLTDETLSYATPAGDDGLDEVRTAGWLRTSSTYWRYTGLDATGRPQVTPRTPTAGCD